MRIAVCLSGQPRTWRTSLDNIKRYFSSDNNNIQFDYFIHTWDVNTYRDPEKKTYEISEIVKLNISEKYELEEAFRPKKIEFEEYNSIKYDKWNNLFFSFMKSVWLKRKYELENDFLYDIVVKTRTDINFPLNIKFPINSLRPLVAYNSSQTFNNFPNEFNYYCFDDVIFYSDSPTMDIISNIYWWNSEIYKRGYDNLNNERFIEDVEFFYGPGTLLYSYLINNSIHPQGSEFIPYYVVRKNAEEQRLNGLRDWEKIYNISKEHYNCIIKTDKRVT